MERYGQIEFNEEEKQEEKVQKKGLIKELIDGTLLTRSFVIRQLPYIVFLTVLAFIYIANHYHAEKLVRQQSELQSELQELRARAITVSAELMHISRQSEVLKLIERENLGLRESTEPPIKIVVKN